MRIARIDHWVKNVFVLPGILVAVSIDRSVLNASLIWYAGVALLSATVLSLQSASCRYSPLMVATPGRRMSPIHLLPQLPGMGRPYWSALRRAMLFSPTASKIGWIL